MLQYATITSKKQVTLPAKLVKKLNLKAGQKIAIAELNGELILTPAKKLVEELAGSVPTPPAWKGRDIDEIINEAKDQYFQEKYAQKKTK
jgi:AbrB family looped-hinge helix DNA binding protein